MHYSAKPVIPGKLRDVLPDATAEDYRSAMPLEPSFSLTFLSSPTVRELEPGRELMPFLRRSPLRA